MTSWNSSKTPNLHYREATKSSRKSKFANPCFWAAVCLSPANLFGCNFLKHSIVWSKTWFEKVFQYSQSASVSIAICCIFWPSFWDFLFYKLHKCGPNNLKNSEHMHLIKLKKDHQGLFKKMELFWKAKFWEIKKNNFGHLLSLFTT